jgi:hypothetical protein
MTTANAIQLTQLRAAISRRSEIALHIISIFILCTAILFHRYSHNKDRLYFKLEAGSHAAPRSLYELISMYAIVQTFGWHIERTAVTRYCSFLLLLRVSFVAAISK